MSMLFRRATVSLLFVVLLLNVAQAATRDATAVVDGIRVYIGVLPAELLLGPDMKHAGIRSPDPAHLGLHAEHLVVALFDEQTGARVANAQVTATIIDSAGRSGGNKPLEPMQIAGTTTYGNFVEMSDREDYLIRLKIKRSADLQPLQVEFSHTHSNSGQGG